MKKDGGRGDNEESKMVEQWFPKWSVRTPRGPRDLSGGPWKIKIDLGVPEQRQGVRARFKNQIIKLINFVLLLELK